MHEHWCVDKLLFAPGAGCIRVEYLKLAGNKPAKLLEFLLFTGQSGSICLGHIELGSQNPGWHMVFVHTVGDAENRIL